MAAVAVTDSSNMFGALEFSNTAATNGVQPIIGCELNISSYDEGLYNPMVFLAKDDLGYRNLLKLISQAYLKGEDTHTPRVPFSVLEKYSKNMIALTGGPAGPVGQLLQQGSREKAKILLKQQLSIFGDRLYVEIGTTV